MAKKQKKQTTQATSQIMPIQGDAKHLAFKVDHSYLKTLQAIADEHKKEVLHFKLEEVLDRLVKCCTGEQIDRAKANVQDLRVEWVSKEFDTKDGGETRRLRTDELEYCLMISTYTDIELFSSVSSLLNEPVQRQQKSKKDAVEAAQFWVSCIRWSLENVAQSFPGWVHRGRKWRGLKFRYDNLNARFEKGCEIAWYTIKSTTCSKKVMKEPHFAGTAGPRTIFEIIDCPAVDISQISRYVNEKECLLWPGSFFEVEDAVRRERMCDGDPFVTADRVVLRFKGYDIQSFRNARKYTRPAMVVIGNPGSGKSTMLNRYAGSPKFGAGFHASTGLTSELQTSELTDAQGRKSLLMDTPGLADIDPEKRESAAAAIFNALMMVEDVRVFFVVTLQAGRIRPEDVDTVQMVLKACEDLEDKFQYGLIVNQCPPLLMRSQKEQSVIKQSFQKLFEVKKLHIHFAPNDADLLDEKPYAPLGTDTLQFLHRVPVTCRQMEIKKVNIHAYKVAVEQVKKLQEDVRVQVYRKKNWQWVWFFSFLTILGLIGNCIHWYEESQSKDQELRNKSVHFREQLLAKDTAELEHWAKQLEMENEHRTMREGLEKQFKREAQLREEAEKRMQAKEVEIHEEQRQMQSQQLLKEKESKEAEEVFRAKQAQIEDEHRQMKENLDEQLKREEQLKVEAEERIQVMEMEMQKELRQIQEQLLETKRDGAQAVEEAEVAYKAKESEHRIMKEKLEQQQNRAAQLKAELEESIHEKESEMQKELRQMKQQLENKERKRAQDMKVAEAAHKAKQVEAENERFQMQKNLEMQLTREDKLKAQVLRQESEQLKLKQEHSQVKEQLHMATNTLSSLGWYPRWIWIPRYR